MTAALRPLPDGPYLFVSFEHPGTEDEAKTGGFVEAKLIKAIEEWLATVGMGLWYDDRILPGQEWMAEIDKAIDGAVGAVLLVTRKCALRGSVIHQEFDRVFARDIPFFWLPTRRGVEAARKEWPKLTEAEALHKDLTPLNQLDPKNPGWNALVEARVDECLDRLLAAVESLAPLPAEPAPAAVHPTLPPPADEPGRTNAPQPGRGTIAEPELIAELRDRVLRSGSDVSVVSGRDDHGVGVFGQGGIGKSVLVQLLAHDPDVRRAFPDGACWVDLGEGVGENAKVTERLADALAWIEGEAPTLGHSGDPEGDLSARLRKALATRRVLLIVDDVWQPGHLEPFQVASGASRLLVTSRSGKLCEQAGLPTFAMPPLDDEAAARFLAEAAGKLGGTPAGDAAAVERIVAHSGGLRQNLMLAAALAAHTHAWAVIADRLDELRTRFEAPRSTVAPAGWSAQFRFVRLALHALETDDPETWERFRSCAVFPDDVAVPVATVARLWEVSAEVASAAVASLERRGLVQLAGERDTFRMHDLAVEYLRLVEDRPAGLHRRLLKVHRTLLGDGRWANLPAGVPYLWDQLDTHLMEAGLPAELVAVALDVEFVAACCASRGVVGTIDLLDRAERTAGELATEDLLDAAKRDGVAELARVVRRERVWIDGQLAGGPRFGETVAEHDAKRVPLLAAVLSGAVAHPSVRRPSGVEGMVTAVPRTEVFPDLQAQPPGHTGGLWCVAFSPDGTRLATSSADGAARIWDTTTGQQILLLDGHNNEVVGVALSPDGTSLATASRDGTARIWDTTTGEQVLLLDGHNNAVWGVAFSPDGTRLATASADRTARIWDTRTGEQILLLGAHHHVVRGVAYSGDGTRLATTSRDGTARIWDTTTGQPTLVLDCHKNEVFGVAFSPAGTSLATASRDGTARIWDTTTGQPTLVLDGHMHEVWGVAFSPDGTSLATASRDRTARIWDTTTGQQTSLLNGHSNTVWGVAFSPDGRLATASADGTARIWDIKTSEQVVLLDGHNNEVRGVAFSPDGTSLATAGSDGTARIWDTTTGQQTRLFSGHSNEVWGVAFLPDGSSLATASSDGTARIWDTTTGQQSLVVHSHGEVRGLAFSPDGNRLATASSDGTARVWDAVTGLQTLLLHGHKNEVRGVTFSPDGNRLATASRDGTARVWDAVTGDQTLALDGDNNELVGVTFSPDGNRLATASRDGTARIWNTTTSQQILRLDGHNNAVRGVAFSPDGNRLATASSDGTTRIWDTATGDGLAMLATPHALRAVAWHPSGGSLVVGVGSRFVIYDLALPTPASTA